MLNCFSKYLKIYKITKVSQRNFALVNNFGFSRKTHHLIKNRLLSSCPNIEENIKVKNFSTQFCLTRFPQNFEKKKHGIQKQNQNPQLMTGVCRFRTINLRWRPPYSRLGRSLSTSFGSKQSFWSRLDGSLSMTFGPKQLILSQKHGQWPTQTAQNQLFWAKSHGQWPTQTAVGGHHLKLMVMNIDLSCRPPSLVLKIAFPK